MAGSATVIETKTKAFAKEITTFLNKKRKDKISELTKKGDKEPDKKLVQVTFAYSSGKGSLSRTPEAQAESVSKGRSWTCSGAHMVDKARHVKMLYGAPGKKPGVSWDVKSAFGTKDEHFCSLADLKTKWKAVMKSQELKNYKGGDGWGEGDAFHFELDDSKVPHSDKRVQACLAHYAKITRVEGKPRNNSFETSKTWKPSLAPHLKKVEEEAKKKEEEKAKEELKKMRFEGSAAGKQSLLKKSNKSATTKGTALPAITFEGPLDAGAPKEKKVDVSTALPWDSLARDIFEYLGLTESKGFDVKIACGVSYVSVTYPNLTQSFLHGLTPRCALIYNTPAQKALGMTVNVTSDVKLAKSGAGPKGTVAFEMVLETPIDRDKGTIVISIDGAKATARAQHG